MNAIYNALTSDKTTFRQKIVALAQAAEGTLDVLNLPERYKVYAQDHALCDMFEGNAPYRPRYVMVDFAKFMKQGSEFLKIAPPADLGEAIAALQMLYFHIPSITTLPVYLGDMDKLLDPFLDGLSDEDIKKQLRNFLNYIDRTVADGFCHANLGPEATRAGRLILEVEMELQNAVPNFTLKYDPEITPDDFAELAIKCSLTCSNPAICNDPMNRDTFPGGYGISSCYNLLPLRGGSYTLSRVVLPRLVKYANGTEEFLNNILPDALQALGEFMNERITFLVEKSGFFQSDFLTREGLIERERFTAMFGVAGLCDAANELLADKGLRYGHDAEADDLAERIMVIIQNFVDHFPAKYCEITNDRFVLHAQVGLQNDEGVTSGVRITVGDEPDNILDHLRHSCRFHRFFPAGCSDIFPFDITAERNPAAVLDMVKGAFSLGDRYVAFYASDSDIVRITGYLVKRSEMEKFDRGEVVLHDTVALGSPNYKLNRLKDRKVRSV